MAERKEWAADKSGKPAKVQFEAATRHRGKRGRVDVRLEWKSLVVLLEFKATNWNLIRPHRVRPTALRHIRQLYRYVDGELERGTEGICHGLVYRRCAQSAARNREIEAIFREHFVQLVFRDGG